MDGVVECCEIITEELACAEPLEKLGIEYVPNSTYPIDILPKLAHSISKQFTYKVRPSLLSSKSVLS